MDWTNIFGLVFKTMVRILLPDPTARILCSVGTEAIEQFLPNDKFGT